MKSTMIREAAPRYTITDGYMQHDIIDALEDAISILDTDFRILHLNRKAKDLAGDRIGEYCYTAIKGRDHICNDCPLELTFGDGIPRRVEKINPSGSGKLIVEITTSAIKDPSGKIIAGIESVRDITERVMMENDILAAQKALADKVEKRAADLKRTNSQLEARIAELKEVQEALRENNEKYFQLFENDFDAVMTLDSGSLTFEDVNRAALNLFGFSRKEFLTLKAGDISAEPDETADSIHRIKTSESRRIIVPERLFRRKSGSTFIGEIAAGIFYAGGRQKIICSVRDITERRKAEDLLKKSELQLREQKKSLEQKNIALRELMEQVNIEKNKLKEDIAVNVEKTLLPLLSKLKLSEDTVKYRDLLKYHMDELASSFGRKIMNRSQTLTPKEIEICNMIKGGLTSKEICNILFISDLTVEKHRRNIRKKLGLSNKKVSLSSFLHRI